MIIPWSQKSMRVVLVHWTKESVLFTIDPRSNMHLAQKDHRPTTGAGMSWEFIILSLSIKSELLDSLDQPPKSWRKKVGKFR
jgi:hypothetical protein